MMNLSKCNRKKKQSEICQYFTISGRIVADYISSDVTANQYLEELTTQAYYYNPFSLLLIEQK